MADSEAKLEGEAGSKVVDVSFVLNCCQAVTNVQHILIFCMLICM